MNKSILEKISMGAILTALTLLPIITLSAREGGGDYRGGGAGGASGHADYNHNYNSNYGNHRDQNYNYGGYGGYSGGYGGYEGYGGVVNPYPAPGSQPGMSDDSNALYQSYLRNNNTGY